MVRGETASGTPHGGNPTVTVLAIVDTNGNGLSVDADDTNIYIRWINWASIIFDSLGALKEIDVNVEIRILAN